MKRFSDCFLCVKCDTALKYCLKITFIIFMYDLRILVFSQHLVCFSKYICLRVFNLCKERARDGEPAGRAQNVPRALNADFSIMSTRAFVVMGLMLFLKCKQSCQSELLITCQLKTSSTCESTSPPPSHNRSVCFQDRIAESS